MNNGKDFSLVQNLIQNNLSFAYNKNVPKVNFNLANEFSEKDVFEFQDFKLSFGSQQGVGISEISHWRLPQTRIKVAFIKSEHYQISLLYYFDYYCILFKSLSKETNSFALDFYDEKHIKHKNELQTASNYNVSCDAYSRMIIMASPRKQDLNNIPKFWLDSIKKEKKLHPLSQLFSFNVQFLQKVDQYWFHVQDLDIDGKLKNTFKKENNAIKILLYTELFLLLGRDEELQPFLSYKATDSVIKRIAAYCSASVSNSGQASQPPSNDVFDILINSHSLDDSFIDQYVQNTWNSISLPCRKLYLIRQVKVNPIRVFAFILLLLKSNLWWREKAFKYLSEIVENSDSDHSTILNLVGLIKLQPSIYFSKGLIVYKNESISEDNYEIVYQKSSLRSAKKGRKVFSFFKLKDGLDIWIDKAATLYVDNQNKFIRIEPNKNTEQNLNTFKINYEDYDIKIPLCWTDFIIKINLLRLKFLFKKNRFQVSIKGSKLLPLCKLNNIEFKFDSKQYHKMYVDLNKSNPVHEISYFDFSGRKHELNEWPFPAQRTLLDVKAADKFGLLHTYVQYQRANSNRNTKIDLLSIVPQPIDILHPFSLKFPKEEPLVYYPSFSKTSLNRLLSTNAVDLKKDLIVYATRGFNSLNSLFLNYLGFFPQIELLENINHTFSQFSLIVGKVSDQTPEKDILALEGKVKSSGKKNVIYISEKDLESWFKVTFSSL